MAEELSETESSMDAPAFYNVEVNPNQRLSSVLLNEFNYLPWSRAISLALGGRSKLGYVNGAIEAPVVTFSTYESWLCKDQLIMSWLLNSMERRIAKIFSYSESSMHLWKQVKEMYGNQNNAACVFQLKKNLASLQKGSKAFVQHLGSLTNMWNELDVYHPHTTDATVLIKRAEEDKIFQLLASLGPEFEDLRSHILMNAELPSFTGVCAIIQREEVRMKVMNQETKDSVSETRAYVSSNKHPESKVYKGKRPDVKCNYCDSLGHIKDRCWILHPELKSKFLKETKGPEIKGTQKYLNNNSYKANHAATLSTEGMVNFTTNPATLINDFAAYLHNKQVLNNRDKAPVAEEKNHTALLGKFASFLAKHDHVSQKDIPGIFSAFSTTLNASNEHDYWIIDSGVTDHMTNKLITYMILQK
ncbi:uncharacterized protein [Malus domestica]|uniref:uncharacterized protein n=1 Tax=Malus domestica TaxID=3750 RepID=UPI0039764F41